MNLPVKEYEDVELPQLRAICQEETKQSSQYEFFNNRFKFSAKLAVEHDKLPNRKENYFTTGKALTIHLLKRCKFS